MSTRPPARPLAAVRPDIRLLILGFDRAEVRRIRTHLDGAQDLPALEVYTSEEAVDGDVTVCAFGPACSGPQAREHLDAVLQRQERPPLTVLFAAGEDPSLFQDLLDADRLHYLTQDVPTADVISCLVESALRREIHPTTSARGGRLDPRLHALARQLATAETAMAASGLAARLLARILDLEHALCWIYDPADDLLFCYDETGQDDLGRTATAERRESAAAGIAGFVLRTGRPLRLETVGQDPRHNPELDHLGDHAEDRLLAVPVQGQHGPLAVLIALRPPGDAPFNDAESQRLEQAAELFAPTLEGLALEALISRQNERGRGVFRQQAIDHHMGGSEREGRLLEMTPEWLRRTYQLLLGILLVLAGFLVLGRYDEFAAGPAVVQVDGRLDVTAQLAGTAMAVDVAPGDSVQAGQLLVRFHGQQEITELTRLRQEYETALLDRLRHPADPATERAISSLGSAVQAAEARLEERSLRAPSGGTVSDLRIRVGRHVQPGEVVLSLARSEPEMAILALLPGHHRPQLRPGMPLRLQINGYPYAYQHLRIERISDEVVGPNEARRLLGQDLGDAVAVPGPVVFVHATLPSTTFASDGRHFALHDGMLAQAEARLRSERLLFTLLPAARALVGPGDAQAPNAQGIQTSEMLP